MPVNILKIAHCDSLFPVMPSREYCNVAKCRNVDVISHAHLEPNLSYHEYAKRCWYALLLQTLLDNNICSYVTSSYCHIRLERVAANLHQLCKINVFLIFLHKPVSEDHSYMRMKRPHQVAQTQVILT
jgi:hypothetical protein